MDTDTECFFPSTNELKNSTFKREIPRLSYNHGQKQLRYSRKKPVSLSREFSNLQFSHFDPLSPFQFCNLLESVQRAYFNIEKGENGGGHSPWQVLLFFKLRKDADRKRLFCLNVSALLSMIVDILTWFVLHLLLGPCTHYKKLGGEYSSSGFQTKI